MDATLTQPTSAGAQGDRPAPERDPGLADFSTDRRVVLLTALSVAMGAISSLVACALLWLIATLTNLAFYLRFSSRPAVPQGHHLGPWVIAVPVVGALIIGLMARFGSEKIRGHGIPEALEAILLGRSRIQSRVAILKPISAAISIGTGGPFGAEGPIIMTGGAFGSIFAQQFHLSAAERKTLLVAGAAAGMSAVFASPVAAALLAVELLLFEWKPRSFIPVAVAAIVASMMGGTMRSPLRAVVFAVELTHDFNLFPALLIGSVAALGVTVLLMRRSILTEKLARRGHHVSREYSVDPFELARVGDVTDRAIPTAPASMKLTELSDLISSGDSTLSQRQGTFIVDGEQRLIGLITRGDLVRALRREDAATMTVVEAGCTDVAVTFPDEPLHAALTKMLHRNIGRLPVVERTDPTHVVGYLGRAVILSARMRLLDEEHRRERN